jgi:hypothetical protein
MQLFVIGESSLWRVEKQIYNRRIRAARFVRSQHELGRKEKTVIAWVQPSP